MYFDIKKLNIVYHRDRTSFPNDRDFYVRRKYLPRHNFILVEFRGTSRVIMKLPEGMRLDTFSLRSRYLKIMDYTDNNENILRHALKNHTWYLDDPETPKAVLSDIFRDFSVLKKINNEDIIYRDVPTVSINILKSTVPFYEMDDDSLDLYFELNDIHKLEEFNNI